MEMLASYRSSSDEDDNDFEMITSTTTTTTSTTTTMAATIVNPFDQMMARPPTLTAAQKILSSYTRSLELPKPQLNAVYAAAAALATEDVKLPKIRGLKKADKIENLIEFYKAMCATEDLSIMEAPYFKHKAAPNQRKRKSQERAEKEHEKVNRSKFTNNDNANAFLWRKPRKGWEFGYPA